MEAVLNSPVTPDGVGKGLHRGETEQKVAGFSAHLLLDAPFGSNHANGSQAFPLLVRVQIVEDLCIAHGPVLSDFQPSMPFSTQRSDSACKFANASCSARATVALTSSYRFPWVSLRARASSPSCSMICSAILVCVPMASMVTIHPASANWCKRRGI